MRLRWRATSPRACGATAAVVDLKREADALYTTYRSEAVRHALLGVGAIVVLLAFALRSAQRVLMGAVARRGRSSR